MQTHTYRILNKTTVCFCNHVSCSFFPCLHLVFVPKYPDRRIDRISLLFSPCIYISHRRVFSFSRCVAGSSLERVRGGKKKRDTKQEWLRNARGKGCIYSAHKHAKYKHVFLSGAYQTYRHTVTIGKAKKRNHAYCICTWTPYTYVHADFTLVVQ